MSHSTIMLFYVAVCFLMLAALEVEASGGFGDACSTAADCTPAFAECVDNKCACNKSDVQESDRCLLPVGGRCKSRSCDAKNSECKNGFCVCPDNYIQTYNNTFCFKAPTHGEYCETDHNCQGLLEYGICENGRCRCSSSRVFIDNMCKKKIDQLGVHCMKETEVCYLERDGNNQKIECKDQICTCIEGVEPSKDLMSCGAGALEVISVITSLVTLLLANLLA